MAKLEACLPYVLANEGGYSEPPLNDQPTNYGIIANSLAKYRKVPVDQITKQDIMNLTVMEATEIYRLHYWNPLRLDEVNDHAIATAILDVGVVRGISVGAKYAQRVCNQLGAALVVDGLIGFRSLAAINACEREKFIRAYENLDAAGFLAIIAHNPKMHIFERGWLARAHRLLSLI